LVLDQVRCRVRWANEKEELGVGRNLEIGNVEEEIACREGRRFVRFLSVPEEGTTSEKEKTTIWGVCVVEVVVVRRKKVEEEEGGGGRRWRKKKVEAEQLREAENRALSRHLRRASTPKTGRK
jgi:hypothetical protein